MERFSLELEATEVFYGKNQSCVGLVELSMPAPLYHAYHDGITSYHLALCEALGRERTSTSASEWVSPTRGPLQGFAATR